MSLGNWIQQTKSQTCNCLKTVCSEILECLEDAVAEDELHNAVSKGGIHGQRAIIKELERRARRSRHE
jgi:hypothetical protein